MTTPMVDTVRNIPLVVERDVPMEDSGFPFDREDTDRDDHHFRSQLDDIAKRHPEFAEHLEGFPFRSDSLGRRRPPRPTESEFRRFTDRPFGSGRFERFFRDPFDNEFEEPQPQQYHHPQQQPEQEPEKEVKVEVEEKPKPERSRKQNIQPSNTVDLGQKQEPVNDRSQRSMSAPPPDNRPRYVSSINIPINRDGGVGTQQQQQQQPQPQQQQQQDKPVERVIPIHVEGRDEPVLPKHTGPSFSPQPQPERIFGGQRFEPQPPQPERIFGQRPSTFTQFVPPRQQQFEPEVKQQQKPPQQAAPPQKQQQQEQQQPQPQPTQKPPTTPIDIIQSIQKDVSELMTQVEKFDGAPKDKQYLYLDEMLTRNLIKLDNIDTQGQENIRQARKEAIKCIERCISLLEAKAAANVASPPQDEKKPEEVEMKDEAKEVEMKEATQESQEDKMEVETKVEEKKEEAEAVAPSEDKMEVVAAPEKTETQEQNEETKMETSEAASATTEPLLEEKKEEVKESVDEKKGNEEEVKEKETDSTEKNKTTKK